MITFQCVIHIKYIYHLFPLLYLTFSFTFFPPLTPPPELVDAKSQEAYAKLLKKRQSTQTRTSTQDQKKKIYTGVRLRLDDALKQLQGANANEKPVESLFDGWSVARIRAYNLIEKNPNAYYYRFNAPGETQRNGAFTAVRDWMRRGVQYGGSLHGY